MKTLDDDCVCVPYPVAVQKITIYAPVIYTRLCIMFRRRGYTLRGEVGGGWALELTSFLGPVKWHRANRRVPFGAHEGGLGPHTVVTEEKAPR